MTQDNQTSRRDVLKTAGATAGALAAGMAGAASATEVPNINAMGPTPEQIQAFMALPEGPVVMVNLIKLKPGGYDEYNTYFEKIQPILASIGARMLFAADAKVCMIGNADWDQIGLVEYPDRTALLKMSQSPEYQAIHHHREAGLEGQVNYAVVQRDEV
ncbi:MAG: DUF1330 domain-containing protein [Acidobacteriota bacterium]